MTLPAFFDTMGEPPPPDTFSARDALLGWMQDIAPYGIFTTDRELRIRTWNHWLAVHSGRTPESVIGRPLFEVFPEVPGRRLDVHYQRALVGEISVLSTALHRYLLPLPSPAREAGTAHMLQTARIAPLPAGDLILGTITIIEDVTQREIQALRLQRQQEHDHVLSSALRVLLESSEPQDEVAGLFPKLTLPLGLEAYFNYLYDESSGTLQLNAASGILPRQKQQIASVRLGESLCGQCAQTRQPLLRESLHESNDPAAEALRGWGFRAYCCFPLLVEGRLVGTLAFASSTRAALAPDEVECLSTIAQYFTIALDRAQREKALREAQRGLREHSDMLEIKVAERTARLHDVIAELESFSYTVAHDLRAPIRALKGYCEILLSDYSLPEGGVAIIGRLQRASDRLDALTRDLLTFTQIARRRVTLAPVDVEEVVQDILVLTPALQPDVLRVESPLPKVRAHRTLLQQCLSNLFENALKFASPKRPPRIVVRSMPVPANAAGGETKGAAFSPAVLREVASAPSAESEGPRVRICVEDNGIGIPPSAHGKIFGIFERVSASEQVSGTGIGLAIVARAMQQMNGSCGVESTPGAGSCFWLELVAAE